MRLVLGHLKGYHLSEKFPGEGVHARLRFVAGDVESMDFGTSVAGNEYDAACALAVVSDVPFGLDNVVEIGRFGFVGAVGGKKTERRKVFDVGCSTGVEI